MGKLEADSRKRKKRADLQRMVLVAVGTAGVVSAALIAPGVLKAMDKLGLVPHRRQETAIQTSRRRLVANGLLVWEGTKLRLTPKGERKLRLLETRNFQLKRPKRWDGRWRVLIFDIPEQKKGLREKIRTTLQRVGFVRLQDSVWIYPYDCEDLITLLKADFKVGKDMLYMIVDTLEYDSPLRSQFGLD